ncbi:histidine phosphatase family protein [Glycomyces algeriensis]|uniref:histidine phosphatase family protein n=1 Tax=Glycomyces algeriensis TaxID=256037 RepID=UPI0022D6C254|nr:histidine phosphatase family protein [Glycomyces algeriensis]MDA1367214.1 histidine phosphatase family protein [Glycomyces algeriensis]MDR7353402.1 broad specificity phosphatase PhoE [Glycomyces algeriensis]
MGIVYVVQHGEKERAPGDPGLTARGREQAALAAEWLRGKGLRAVYASPLLRARQTAEAVAAVAGLPVRIDARVAERMNWDGSVPFERFAADWARASADRDFVPAVGDSSRAAGARFVEFLEEIGRDGGGSAGPVAVACHGGVTVDLLRTLIGDEAVPEMIMSDGVPSGAITTLDGLRPIAITETGHLAGLETGHRPG